MERPKKRSKEECLCEYFEPSGCSIDDYNDAIENYEKYLESITINKIIEIIADRADGDNLRESQWEYVAEAIKKLIDGEES
jgi:hypothetical protein